MCWREDYRGGKATKVPLDPETGQFASTADHETWASFKTVLEEGDRTDADGIGFVFTEEDEFVGVDLDDCRDRATGAVDAWAKEVIDRLDSYTEISPSQTGYHIIVRGTVSGDRCRNKSIEMYETGRFFTMTGDHLSQTPTRVKARTPTLTEIYNEYVQVGEPDNTKTEVSISAELRATEYADQDVLEMAREAANGEKFERLWNGHIDDYDSQSEADIALCCHLAFWTGGDSAQMDQLFRQSGLMRDKWDAVHYGDGSTYGEKTVQRAMKYVDDYYSY